VLLINLASAILAGFNLAITSGLVAYSLRTRKTYRGNMFSGSMSIFVLSTLFFFFAALLRVGLTWGIMVDELEPLEIGARSIAFLSLLAFAFKYFREWTRFRA
jgi:hypothetical protein